MGFGTDPMLKVDILKYKTIFDYDIVIETGTYHGTSSRILSEIFKKVYTCELSDHGLDVIRENIKNRPNIEFMVGNSPDCLKKWFTEIGHDKFFLFLDAHWYDYHPLLDELQTVADFGYKPFIFIHDFYCGHKDWAYDEIKGLKLDFDYVKDKINKIYGESNYVFEVSQHSENECPPHEPNNKRGCGFFYPI